MARREFRERRSASRFDKVFPVYLVTSDGVGRGIARNISSGGIFIETRDSLPLGDLLTVCFVDDTTRVEMAASAEVRHQVFLEYADRRGGAAAMRGMGMRFVSFMPHSEISFVPPLPASAQ